MRCAAGHRCAAILHAAPVHAEVVSLDHYCQAIGWLRGERAAAGAARGQVRLQPLGAQRRWRSQVFVVHDDLLLGTEIAVLLGEASGAM